MKRNATKDELVHFPQPEHVSKLEHEPMYEPQHLRQGRRR